MSELIKQTLKSSNQTDPELSDLFDDDTEDAGSLMSAVYLVLEDNMSVQGAMDHVRNQSLEKNIDEISYILVVDSEGILKGGLNVSQLVISEPTEMITSVMYPDIISVSADTDQEQCALIMEKYNLLTLAVTDSYGRLEGIVKIEDMIDVFQDEATEDMYKMVGVDEEEKILGPFLTSVKGRFPWLFVNLITAGLAAMVIIVFESTLTKVIALAAFLPVIAGQGGIVGTQTLTLMVRSMALEEISHEDTKKLLIKELSLGLVHGFVLGLIAGIVAYFWQENIYLSLVIGFSMMGNLAVAGISGVALPIFLRAMKLDPALSSAVVVTTVTDVVGFLIYLGMATLVINLII
ncbi:MAG: magnesium transporter [Chloroflexi bacterium]|nr:magnesium transporter [Chloroflexota bacterium]